MNQPPSTPRSGTESLEANLEICRAQINKALARAEAVDPRVDEYGHAATSANGDALRFLKMSAKIGLALAKLKGEHTNNINVRRTQVAEQEVRVEFPAPEPRKPSPDANKPLDPATETRLNHIYNDWLTARAAKNGDVVVNLIRDGDEDDEEDREEGDPPPVSGGSNAASA